MAPGFTALGVPAPRARCSREGLKRRTPPAGTCSRPGAGGSQHPLPAREPHKGPGTAAWRGGAVAVVLNHDPVPSKRGNGRLGTNNAGSARPCTGGGSWEGARGAPGPAAGARLPAHARDAGTSPLAPGLRARGRRPRLCSGITASFSHTARHKAGSRAGRRHLRAAGEHRGQVPALGASSQRDSSVLPLCLLAQPALARRPNQAKTRNRCLLFDLLPQKAEPGTQRGRRVRQAPRATPSSEPGCRCWLRKLSCQSSPLTEIRWERRAPAGGKCRAREERPRAGGERARLPSTRSPERSPFPGSPGSAARSERRLSRSQPSQGRV